MNSHDDSVIEVNPRIDRVRQIKNWYRQNVHRIKIKCLTQMNDA